MLTRVLAVRPLRGFPQLWIGGADARCARGLDRVFDRRQKRPFVERLTKVSACTRGQAPRLHSGLVVTRDDDGREPCAGLRKLSLQGQTVHSGHLQVEHKAVRNGRRKGVEELLSRSKGVSVEVGCAQEALKRLADGCIVVDDGDTVSGSRHQPSITDRRKRWELDLGPTNGCR
jgi:hypothetical protein